MMKRRLFLLVAAGCLALAPAVASGPQEENTAAPDFALTDLSGKPLRLADFKGRLLLLNFWATWCPPCRAEIPDFISSYKEYRDQGLAIVGVSVDQLAPAQLKKWVAEAGINYPVAPATEQVLSAYRPGDYIPATILVDRAGRIRYRHVGVMQKDLLVRLFKQFAN
jgi:cytochrome c biogenesis protein CcmG/thiol:disulfide interchange protein DsbE